MKSDLDRLMTERDLQGFIVAGGEGENTIRAYLTNGAEVGAGYIIKKRGSDPVIVCGPMEIEEARKSGLEVYTFFDLGWADLVKAAEGNRIKAEVGMWGNFLKQFDIPPGKIGVYGTGSLSAYIELVKLVQLSNPSYEFVGELGANIFDEAAITKDAEELARIQSVAERTNRVLEQTWDYIAGHDVQGETIIKADGNPLTIGDVKRFVRRALLDVDLEDTGMIFAQGRDGGFPHSRGEAHEALKLGQAIVFDLFPRELGGGYYHDMTRTWCIGYAPPEVQTAYDQVMQAFQIALDTYEEPGQPAHTLQDAVLDTFEAQGHSTTRLDMSAQHGYMHSLGHGIGLNIHERPSLSHLVKKDTIQVGNVFTIEPGLYYPERGFGIRVEDSVYVDESGKLVSLTPFRKDLVLPLKGKS
jgi:Xaa-Pro aminopeptidase